jgi:hypothetical protein
MKRRSSMTAAELAAKLQTNPEFVARKQVREQERTERSAQIQVEEAPILAELREVGWEVQSVWDLVNTSSPYPEAVPILLKHLLLPYSDVVKEGIARSLAVPELQVQEAWPLLVREYRKAPMGLGIKAPGDTTEYRLSAKDGLACALAASVTDETLPELIVVAKDRTLGESRVLLLSALKKLKDKNPLAHQAIPELEHDPELRKEIASWGKS